MRVLYTKHVDEWSGDRPEKRRLESPEIFYVDSARQSRAPVYHGGRRDTHHVPYDNWDEGNQGNSYRGARQQQPRISVVETDSPNAQVTRYSRPPTYDATQDVSSFRRLRQLSLPGVGTA